MWSSSIYKQIKFVFHLQKTEVAFHLQNKLVRLPFANQIEVVFQIWSLYISVSLLGQHYLKNAGEKNFSVWVGRVGYFSLEKRKKLKHPTT
jgi:hypothetical protein